MNRPPLLPRLRSRRHELGSATMPVGARHRVASRLAQEAARRANGGARGLAPRTWIPMATFAAGAALVLMVVSWNLLHSRVSSHEADATPAVAVLPGYVVEGEHCRAHRDGPTAVLAGACRLLGPQLSVQTWEDVRLVLSERTVVLSMGQAMFDVRPVVPGEASVRVVVSHGTIEVLGTRFTVDQTDEGGTVDLFEGHIRFRHSSGGDWVDIAPGQRFGWGSRKEQAPPPEVVGDAEEEIITIEDEPPDTRVGRGVDATPRKPDADVVIARVTALRGAGRYRQASAVLRKALRHKWDGRTGQVLSYELGQILEHHRDDLAVACRHWRRHQARYPQGRYARAVADSLRACP